MSDTDFIDCLKYDVPPVYGVAIGTNRLIMVFTNCSNTRGGCDFVLFTKKGRYLNLF